MSNKVSLEDMAEMLKGNMEIPTINIRVKKCIIDFYYNNEKNFPILLINYFDKDDNLFQDQTLIYNLEDIFLLKSENISFTFVDIDSVINIKNKKITQRLYKKAFDEFLFNTFEAHHQIIIKRKPINEYYSKN